MIKKLAMAIDQGGFGVFIQSCDAFFKISFIPIITVAGIYGEIAQGAFIKAHDTAESKAAVAGVASILKAGVFALEFFAYFTGAVGGGVIGD